jgi:hypothetical protein
VKRLLLAGLLLLGCDPGEPQKAGRWPTYALVERAHEDTAGFPTAWFVSLAGAPMPFRGADYESPPALAAADGWSVLPAFALGQPAAYLVSEVWESHPDPWVQPVYILVTSFAPITRQEVDGVRVPNVFGVGQESTFYSPYWQTTFVKTATPAPAEGLADTRAVLAAASETRVSGYPLCPIVPDDFTFAATAGQAPVQPLTRAPIRLLSTVPVRIDGARDSYIDFGLNKFEAEPNGRVTPTRIFFFTRAGDGKRTLLELPAVLSDNAPRSAYARRFDVVIDKEPVFVPAGAKWDALRTRLQAPAADPDIPAEVAAAYTLRVAKTASCFADAAKFPDGCDWLDSEAAIDRFAPSRVIRTDVTLTATPVHFGGAPL